MPEQLSCRLHVVEGDITRLEVDAIVNAANRSLLGGGGIDGAIHAAAGPKLLAECRSLGGCPTGEARMTDGHALPARHVIHAVGPRWRGGKRGEPDLLRSCYLESLRLAQEAGLETIAFPTISTGVYDYPRDPACGIALEAASDWLAAHELPHMVTFCCFTAADAEPYRRRLGRRAASEEVRLWSEQAPEVAPEWFRHFSELHGVRHTQRVHVHAERLASLLEWPAADTDLLLRAALWHDIGREHDGFEPEHGGNSVLRARELGLVQCLSAADAALIEFAMRQHSLADALGEDEAGAQAESERALRILHLLKDADALDRVRLIPYDGPRPELLRHRCAVDSIEFAQGLLEALR